MPLADAVALVLGREDWQAMARDAVADAL